MHWILPEQSSGSCLPMNRMVEFNVTCFQKVVLGLMMVLKKSFERENNNQPKEEKKRREEAYCTMLMDGTTFAINCANPLVVADSWL